MSGGPPDFYLVDELLTDEERGIRDRLRAFCEAEVLPVINGYWERAEFPHELVPKIAELKLAGGTIEGYGCPGMSAVAAGLVSMEWARADGSLGTFYGVHSNLAMQAIHMLGSEEQRERWLPGMAALEQVGAFALTEPEHGSDAVMLETQARKHGDEYVLNGRKRWIGNGSFADVVLVWARGEDGNVGGFVVEKGTPGYHATVMEGKTSLRAVWQADIELVDVRVPEENRLERCNSFRDVAEVLTRTRYTVAWRALGIALAAYETALSYARGREQFGQPIASYQLVQDKLSRMLAEITAMQLLCLRLSQLAGDGRLTPGMASLAKMNHAAKARQVVADARDILGGNGILLENHVARHHADMEAIFTFEGTDRLKAKNRGRKTTGVLGDRAGEAYYVVADYIGAIDQGTTSSRFILFDADGHIAHVAQKEHEQITPEAGWVEHDATEVWRRTREVIGGALASSDVEAGDIAAIGITNQRETTVVWDRESGEPVYNAIVWQDTRTGPLVREFAGDEGLDRLRDKTGLPLSTYFSGPKIAWILDNVDGARERAENGELAFGTMDTWVLWNLTGGRTAAST